MEEKFLYRRQSHRGKLNCQFGSGIAFSISYWKLFLLSLLSLATAGAAVYYTAYRLFDFQLQKETKAFLEGREFGKASVKNKIKLLADEVSRVRRYEGELKNRVQYLETILGEAELLDVSSDTGEEAYSTDALNVEEDLAVGGADEPHARILRDSSSLARIGPSPPKKADLISTLDQISHRVSHVPVGLPVLGKITSFFGRRHSPFSHRVHTHEGLDIGAPWRTPLVATANGVVVEAGWEGAFGRRVLIDHGNDIETFYGHLSRIHVKVGDKVCRGQRIGLIGSTGRSTGPHVHYEVRVKGEPQDPMKFVDLAQFLKFLHI